MQWEAQSSSACSWIFTVQLIRTTCSEWSEQAPENISIFNRGMYQGRGTSGWECANYRMLRWAGDLSRGRGKWSNLLILLPSINPGKHCTSSQRQRRGGGLLFAGQPHWLALSWPRRAGAPSYKPQAQAHRCVRAVTLNYKDLPLPSW